MSTREQKVLDVSGLPTVVFGPRALLWWGTLGFIVIEGFTLVLAVASYLYLRQNEFNWPPGRTPNPDLLIPTINTVLLLATMYPMYRADHASKAFDRAGVIRWLLIGAAMSGVACVLRWWDLLALNVRWDTHAYGSAVWMVVVLHATLIILDFFESLVLAVMFVTGRAQKKHYPDVSDAAGYQYYLSLTWLVLYLIIYWGPRVL